MGNVREMGERTSGYKSAQVEERAGSMSAPDGGWTFEYDQDQVPLVSSGMKRIYSGVFFETGSQRALKARALVFQNRAIGQFGAECANLSLLGSLGVGPRLLAIAQGNLGGGTLALPIIIEEDAGQSLASLLETGVSSGGAEDDTVIHECGTPARELENAKILYDIFIQVINAHAAGIYHRDLRCENVCVRRFGPSPADIRATVVDFDLGAPQDAGRTSNCAHLFNTLFHEVPLVLGIRRHVVPTAVELDMGYLAALQFHLETGSLALNGKIHERSLIMEFVEFLKSHVPFFGYAEQLPYLHARELSERLDLDGLAARLGLVCVDERAFPSHQLRDLAESLHRPFLDGEDMRWVLDSPEARLASSIDMIARAKFETYKSVKASRGESIKYDRLEEQPLDFIRSTYAQAEHISTKISALGYQLVPLEQANPRCVVSVLTEGQIEALARLEHARFVEERLKAGWVLDRSAKESDPVRKISPNLVSYDELADDVRNYDREDARGLIALLRDAGLAVVRGINPPE
ncbi:MAG: hypothetical protein IKG18_17505 [Atopobiaceae bacterium]|nr:hypothetical protein [Atopobiaceae bacterium]